MLHWLVHFTLLFSLFALAPQAVNSLSFSFSTAIEQCGPFTVSFIGKPDFGTTSFTILSSNNVSTVFTIPLPNDGAEESWEWTMYLPFVAGTRFKAMMGDLEGMMYAEGAAIPVSVLPPSTFGGWSCLVPLNIQGRTGNFTDPSTHTGGASNGPNNITGSISHYSITKGVSTPTLVIIVSVTGAVIMLCALGMFIYTLRKRRNKQLGQVLGSEPSFSPRGAPAWDKDVKVMWTMPSSPPPVRPKRDTGLTTGSYLVTRPSSPTTWIPSNAFGTHFKPDLSASLTAPLNPQGRPITTTASLKPGIRILQQPKPVRVRKPFFNAEGNSPTSKLSVSPMLSSRIKMPVGESLPGSFIEGEPPSPMPHWAQQPIATLDIEKFLNDALQAGSSVTSEFAGSAESFQPPSVAVAAYLSVPVAGPVRKPLAIPTLTLTQDALTGLGHSSYQEDGESPSRPTSMLHMSMFSPLPPSSSTPAASILSPSSGFIVPSPTAELDSAKRRAFAPSGVPLSVSMAAGGADFPLTPGSASFPMTPQTDVQF